MPPKPLKATVDSLSEHRAVLLIDDEHLSEKMKNQKLILPKKLLPGNIKEGDILVLDIQHSEDYTKQREEIARKLLEDILNNK